MKRIGHASWYAVGQLAREAPAKGVDHPIPKATALEHLARHTGFAGQSLGAQVGPCAAVAAGCARAGLGTASGSVTAPPLRASSREMVEALRRSLRAIARKLQR